MARTAPTYSVQNVVDFRVGENRQTDLYNAAHSIETERDDELQSNLQPLQHC
jgi:hypothetical protein